MKNNNDIQIKKNDKVQIINNSFHSNQIGYFQFEGEGKSQGVAVLSVSPVTDPSKPQILFCVGISQLEIVKG